MRRLSWGLTMTAWSWLQNVYRNSFASRRQISSEIIKNWGLWDQTAAWGIMLPVAYFRDVFLFDVMHRTDTRLSVVNNRYSEQPSNFAHGKFYAPSWTSEIKRSFENVRALLGIEFDHHTFVESVAGRERYCSCGSKKWIRQEFKRRLLG